MKVSLLSLSFSLLFASFVFAGNTIVLDGNSATYKDIVSIADGAVVDIKKDALKRVEKSHDTLINAAEEGQMIYGLTVGVGLNKDRKMVDATGKLTTEVIDASKLFNVGLIHAHCGWVGDPLDIRSARAVMAARLNNMLYGGSGIQTEIVLLLKDMLNKNIIPVIPGFGSVGMADITILGHIGLAMIGEGDVYYNGKLVKAADALKNEGLKRADLFGKDALSIVSSNAYSAGLTSLLMNDMARLIKSSKILYALSLEALNGNVVPFSKEAAALRPYADFVNVSAELRAILKGSYLFDKNPERSLQDPLSFRDTAYYIAALMGAFGELEEAMKVQLNSSDDNPGVLVGAKGEAGSGYEIAKVFVKGGGAVVPNGNFDPVIWVLALEKMSLSIGANSSVSAQRITRLDDDYFTKLPRFLGTEKTVHAFGAMQKPFAALNAQNLFLSNPLMLYNVPVAGNIEDISTNAPAVAIKVKTQIDNLFQIYGIELVHAAQAIDLRKGKPGFHLSPETKAFYDAFREKIKFLDTDRVLTEDFAVSAEFLKNYKN